MSLFNLKQKIEALRNTRNEFDSELKETPILTASAADKYTEAFKPFRDLEILMAFLSICCAFPIVVGGIGGVGSVGFLFIGFVLNQPEILAVIPQVAGVCAVTLIIGLLLIRTPNKVLAMGTSKVANRPSPHEVVSEALEAGYLPVDTIDLLESRSYLFKEEINWLKAENSATETSRAERARHDLFETAKQKAAENGSL